MCRGQQRLGHLVGRDIRGSDADADAHADADGNSQPVAYTDANSIADSEPIPDSVADTAAHSHADPGLDTISDTDSISNAQAISNAHAFPDTDALADSDAFAEPVSHRHALTYVLTHAHCDANSGPYDRRGIAALGHGGHFYRASLELGGGTPPYTVFVSAGAFPRGLALDTFDGEISGTPGTAGTSTLTVYATDRSHQSASRTFQISIKR
jgi:hypothetical protein